MNGSMVVMGRGRNAISGLEEGVAGDLAWIRCWGAPGLVVTPTSRRMKQIIQPIAKSLVW